MSRDEAKAAIEHYAKRQITWFRNRRMAEWTRIEAPDTGSEIAMWAAMVSSPNER